MGIQIYIRKESLKELNLGMKEDRELVHSGCQCGEVSAIGEFCDTCNSYAEDWFSETFEVEGLNLVMHNFGDVIWHDANHWGSSRELIMDFIEKHKLKAGQDWYEA